MYIVCNAENLRGYEKIIHVPFLRKTLYYNDLVKLFPAVCLAVCLEKPMNLDKDSLRHRRFNYVNDAD